MEDVRESVAWFAGQMETVLRANDHKAGWDRCTISYLRRRLNDEVRELHRRFEHDPIALDPEEAKEMHAQWLQNIIKEAADVANFAMMLADRARREMGTADGPNAPKPMPQPSSIRGDARLVERERCLSIVRSQPFYPDTHTGTRQRWVKDEIERKIRSGEEP